MTKPGPKPVPTAVLAYRGSWRAKVRSDNQGVEGVPEPPAWLSTEARAEWDRQVEDLSTRGLLTSSDRVSLVLYCSAWAEFCEAEQNLAAHGATEVTTRGNKTLNPYVRIRRDARESLIKLGVQFGFSPSSRVNLPNDPTGPGINTRDRSKARFFQADDHSEFLEA